jgi:hypothetical protein
VIATIAIFILATVAVAVFYLAPRIAPPSLVFELVPDRPCPFGYRMAWLAIRTRDTPRVVEVLGLGDPRPANWQTGIGTIYDREHAEQRVFVSPPVNGWTFVVGLSLPQPVGRGFVDKCLPLVTELGREFIEVQYYLTHPVIDFHAWARIVDGKLVRAFAMGDEGILWNRGKPTKEEKSLGLKLFELRGVRGRRGDAGGELILHPTEDHVMRLASRWSLDPTVLDRNAVEPATGLIAWVPAAWAAERMRKAG